MGPSKKGSQGDHYDELIIVRSADSHPPLRQRKTIRRRKNEREEIRAASEQVEKKDEATSRACAGHGDLALDMAKKERERHPSNTDNTARTKTGGHAFSTSGPV